MLKLGQSSTFKKEYDYFKQRISQIENVEFKEELNAILSRLVSEVKNIDQLHSDLALTNRLPVNTSDSRNSLLNLRKLLINKLRDWDEFIKETGQN